MTTFQQQAWKKTLDNEYPTAYTPEQILAAQDYIIGQLARYHIGKESKERLFTTLLNKAQAGQQLTDMVLEANTKIRDLNAEENGWIPLFATHRQLFSNDELIVIANSVQTGFKKTLWGLIHANKIRQHGKTKNWDLSNQMRQLIQLLGEKPDYEHIKQDKYFLEHHLRIQYKTRVMFQRNKLQPTTIKNQIQYTIA